MVWTSITRRHSRRPATAGAVTTAIALVVVACGGAASPSAGAASPSAGAASPSTQAASPAASTAGKPLLVAINRGASEQYFIDLQSAFKAEVEKLGGTAKTFDAKEDQNLTISLMNDAVSAGAKGIAATAQSSDLGPALAKIAKNASVAYVATDVTQKDAAGNSVPFVGFDGKAMGTAVSNEVVTLLDKAGWSKDSSKKVGVLSVEAQSISVCEDRTNASKEILKGAGFPAGNIYQVPYDGSTAAGQTAAGPVITAHPDVTNWVIFSCNDEGVLGAINALTTAGAKPENVIGVGIGAYEACKPWTASQPSGFKAALFISGLDVGKAAADALWANVVDGTPLPAMTIAKTTMVDPANYAQILDPVSLANCKK
jgi:L-arabinose transport system substrate-binding protein